MNKKNNGVAELHEHIETKVSYRTDKENFYYRELHKETCEIADNIGIKPSKEFIKNFFAVSFYPRTHETDKTYFREWVNRFTSFSDALSRCDFYVGEVLVYLLDCELIGIADKIAQYNGGTVVYDCDKVLYNE